MKLIDIENCEFQRYEPQNDLAYALGWNDCVDCIEEELSNETPIEAITIEWLKQKYKENDPDGGNEDFDRYLWDSICYVLTAWYEDQEEEDPIAWKDELEEE